MWQSQPIEKKSLKNLKNKLFFELGDIGYCYWDDKLTLPLSLLPHVIPISKNLKENEVPSFDAPEKTTVSFFVQGWLEEWQSIFGTVLSRHQFSICHVYISLDHAHSTLSTQFEKLLIDCMECEEIPHPQAFIHYFPALAFEEIFDNTFIMPYCSDAFPVLEQDYLSNGLVDDEKLDRATKNKLRNTVYSLYSIFNSMNVNPNFWAFGPTSTLIADNQVLYLIVEIRCPFS